MTADVPPSVPRERQTIRLSPANVDSFREWTVEGTGLTAAARVTDSEGRIALVKNSWSDGWIVPGGAVEPGEALVDAARREVREETGLEATVDDPLLVVEQTYVSETESDATVRLSAQFVVFDARANGSIPDTEQLGVESGEIEAARWFETLPPELHEDDLFRPYLRG
ncbi:NUDIX domain-containing protein [Natronococcus sp. JC468]|uniref:NUDIX hydrolase n=1 Tax=Natronococcus sp. JC468 TaxID=1961921 RepID=UPI00143CA68E|nr:NUDIX domain-containing protein [Natronococcus sp. JC468]NKE36394.1 NUDIX domain-containing protein [Natronococcus sp. JC468]